MAWGVWVTVSGGVTGSREAWLKGENGEARAFPTVAAAEAEAERLRSMDILRGGVTPSGRLIAHRYYRAAEVV